MIWAETLEIFSDPVLIIIVAPEKMAFEFKLSSKIFNSHNSKNFFSKAQKIFKI